ncbi:hypothetical protein IAR50_001534 [Cryptococcus sp. DSM 104548]
MASTPPSPGPRPGDVRSLPRRAGYTYSHPAPSRTPVPRPNSLYLRYRTSPEESSAMTDVESGIDRSESSSEDETDDYQSDAEGLLEVTTDDDLAKDGDDEESDVDCGLEAGPYSPTPTPSLKPQTPKLPAFAIIGRKRSRSADSSDESDQEECRAGHDEKRRPIKHARKSSYPPEKVPDVLGSLDGLDRDFSSLRTSSLVMRAEMQVNPTQAFLDAAASISKAPMKASSRLKARQQGFRKLYKKSRGRKWSSPAPQRDPLVDLPALQAWGRDSWHFTGDTPDIDIDSTDRRYDSDASMRSISDSGPLSSDVEMLSVSRIPVTSPVEQPAVDESRPKLDTVARPRYAPAQPLSDKQVAKLGWLKSGRDVQRLPRHQNFAVRAAGQHSTSRLRRTSPTSLLPVRRGFCGYSRQLLDDPIVRYVDAFTLQRAGRVLDPYLGFRMIFSGASRIAIFRAQRAARKFRIEAVKAQSERINERIAERRRWHEAIDQQQSAASVDTYQDQAVEEAAVEDLTERQLESSPEPCPALKTRSRKRARQPSATPHPEERQVRPRTEEDPEVVARQVASIECALRARAAEQRAREEQSRRQAEQAAEERQREDERIREEERLLALRQVQEEADSRIARELSLALDDNLTDISSESSEASGSVAGDEPEEAEGRLRLMSPALSDVTVRSDPPEYEPPNPHPLGAFPSSANISSNIPFVRHIPHRPRPQTPPQTPARLPSYNQAWQARWTRASPPPPPPYNAQTDRETVMAARYEAEQEPREGAEMYEFGGRRRFAPAGRAERETERAASPEPDLSLVGAFPSPSQSRPRAVELVAPVPRRLQVDSVVAFEAALDMEEGEVDQGLFEDEEEEERGPVGALQRVWRRLGWGGRQ